MKAKQILILITILVIVLITIWFVVNTLSRRRMVRPPPSPEFTDIRADFRSKPKSMWMTDNHDRFIQELKQSRYRYKIYESNGNLIYDNRSGVTTDIRFSLEYMAACTLGEYTLIGKDNNRYMAIRVTDKASRYRIVHITGAGLSDTRI